MPDDDAPAAPAGQPSFFSTIFSSKRSRGAVDDPELRERMRTLDPTERKWGFGAAGLTLAVGAIFIPSLLHNTNETVTAAPVKGACTLPYTYNHATKLCEHVVVHHPSEFILEFSLLVGLGLVLLFAVWKSMRSLVIFTSVFIGLATRLSPIGLIPLAFGVWLFIRSWRLSRYGTKNSKEVRQVATQRTAAKREAKRAGTAQVDPLVKSAPTPSKRYTPSKRTTAKSKPRRK